MSCDDPCLSLSTPPTAQVVMAPTARAPRARGSILRQGQSMTVPPPFPWATNRRAMVYPISYLLENNIKAITGKLHCRRCDRGFEVSYDLLTEFENVSSFIARKMASMNDRAPTEWITPTGPVCPFCNQSTSVKTVPSKKKAINWLFLFLGQMLGFCKLSELKYFCKHTLCHRTGAKDRVLYSTYLELWKQLDPQFEFTPRPDAPGVN